MISPYHSVQMSTQSQIWLQCKCWQQTVPNRYIEVKFDVGYFQWNVSIRCQLPTDAEWVWGSGWRICSSFWQNPDPMQNLVSTSICNQYSNIYTRKLFNVIAIFIVLANSSEKKKEKKEANLMRCSFKSNKNEPYFWRNEPDGDSRLKFFFFQFQFHLLLAPKSQFWKFWEEIFLYSKTWFTSRFSLVQFIIIRKNHLKVSLQGFHWSDFCYQNNKILLVELRKMLQHSCEGSFCLSLSSSLD